MKRLVQEAHARGLMVFLDVVYNHFGPDGNYLYVYAQNQFFTDRHHTPWGKANNFDGPGSRVVRDFFIHNALYWLEEFHIDGLRLDAVHAILDDSGKHFLIELAERVRAAIPAERHVHLVLENDANQARFLERDRAGRRKYYDAQWNDDIHHVLHCLLTDETGGYYQDYADDPMMWLGRVFESGFAYQGEESAHRGGRKRGEPSDHLPPVAFVSFLQNHDQIGNRALGERIDRLAPLHAVRAATALLLLAPMPPLLFMGEEWGASTPFLYFCDFGPQLARAVREGRRREFSAFPQFRDPKALADLPDPNDPGTFARSKLDWTEPHSQPHQRRLHSVRELLRLRHEVVIPRLRGIKPRRAECRPIGPRAFKAVWEMADGARLGVIANLSPVPLPAVFPPAGRLVYSTYGGLGSLPAWGVDWYLDENK